MAGRNAQERFQILERRKRVAGMYLQGMKQWEIGRQLNVTQQCIAKDIQALEKEWLASAVVAIDAAKAKELARIDRLERVAWARLAALVPAQGKGHDSHGTEAQ